MKTWKSLLEHEYLLRSIRIPWIAPDDPPEVKTALRDFDEASREERQRRMEQLAASENAQSVAALCRVMRFEIDPVLSKRAALLAMAVTVPESVQQRRGLAGMVRSTVAGSRRPAGQWLLAYASTLEEPLSSLGEWARLTAQETEVLAPVSRGNG